MVIQYSQSLIVQKKYIMGDKRIKKQHIQKRVVHKLQHIADSNDSMRRSRGRRGLEVLHRLRTEGQISMQVLEKDYDQRLEVDAKLVKLAKEINASLITTDFNLNRIADFEGVRVLNINILTIS